MTIISHKILNINNLPIFWWYQISDVKGKVESFVSLLISTILVIIISIIYFAIVLVVVGGAADVAGFDDLHDSYAVLSASILVLAILLSSAISEKS